jgi:hypothetical protein
MHNRIFIPLLLLMSSGCSLGENAFFSEDETTERKKTLREFAFHLNSASNSASNLGRSSGEVTYLRLKTLFPEATTEGRNPDLDPYEFKSLTATDLNRSIAQETRPSSSLAQVGLRKWAARLCEKHANPAIQGSGALFSTEGILIDDEVLPEDASSQLAFAAARNVWLDIYEADSTEVQLLKNLYESAQEKNSEKDALQVLCMAALMAPQFWMGNSGPLDPLRRAALEIGRTIPSFSDYEAYLNGRLTLADYVKKLQTDPEYREGYLQTVRTWHQSWWGLRNYLRGSDRNTGISGIDQRSGDHYGFSVLGQGQAIAAPQSTLLPAYRKGNGSGRYNFENGKPLLHVVGGVGWGGRTMDSCQPEINGQPNEQAFDPRTTILTFEHRNYQTGNWEIVGAYVHPSARSEFLALMSYDKSYDFVSMCSFLEEERKNSSIRELRNNSKYVEGYPNYYHCKGRVSLPGGGYKTTQMFDYDDGVPSSDRADFERRYPIDRPVGRRQRSDLDQAVEPNALYGTVHEYFNAGDRRLRRKAPSGWQDGVSQVRMWYTGETAYACNNLSRYWMTCAYRPPVAGYRNWWYVNFDVDGGHYGSRGDLGTAVVGAGIYDSTIANPFLLNQFRCGKPRLDQVASDVSPDFDEYKVYPHGYDLDHYPHGALSNINPLATTVTSLNGGGPVEENEAIRRLTADLMNEPYYLLEYVINNSLPYSELFTADYTFGHEELELYYRSQAYSSAGLSSELYVPVDARAPARTQLRKIHRADLPETSAQLVQISSTLLIIQRRTGSSSAQRINTSLRAASEKTA